MISLPFKTPKQYDIIFIFQYILSKNHSGFKVKYLEIKTLEYNISKLYYPENHNFETNSISQMVKY